jgi:hypothetical protein
MLVVVLASSGAVAWADSTHYGGVTPGPEGSNNLPPKADEIPEGVLHHTRVHLKNNYRPLETEFFDTPVTRATVQRAGKKGVVMVFEMREDVTPTVTQKKGKDGFNYVFVKFGP